MGKNLLIPQHYKRAEKISDYKRGYTCNLPFDDECIQESECPCERLRKLVLRMPVHKKEFDLLEDADE